jgi:hypothetical protein
MSVSEAPRGDADSGPHSQANRAPSQGTAEIEALAQKLNDLLDEKQDQDPSALTRDWIDRAMSVATRIENLGSGAHEAQGSDQPPSPQDTHGVSDLGSGVARSTNDSIGGAGNGSSNGTR